MNTNKLLYSFVIVLCLLGCESTRVIPRVEGGMRIVKQMHSKWALGQSLEDWCKYYNVKPALTLPIKYPDHPKDILNDFCPNKNKRHASFYMKRIRRTEEGTHTTTVGNINEFYEHTDIDSAQWRKYVFGGDPQSSYKDVAHSSIRPNWVIQNKIKETLPLDGTYMMNFIYLYRSSKQLFCSRSDVYLLLITAPNNEIVGIGQYASYKINQKILKRMEKIGVYVF